MNEHMESFDYLKVTVEENLLSQYIDGYEKFGWKLDENIPTEKNMGKAILHMKRGRKISNKVELTRLQKHYEACMEEICAMEASKNSIPAMVSLSCGLGGCGFMAGSVFAVTAQTPIIWLTVLLAIPGFLLWAASYFCYKAVKNKRAQKVEPLIETKYEEAYGVCEKAFRLLQI